MRINNWHFDYTKILCRKNRRYRHIISINQKLRHSFFFGIVHSKRTVADLPCAAEVKLLTKLSSAYDELFILTEKLEADTLTAESMTDVLETAKFYHKTILFQHVSYAYDQNLLSIFCLLQFLSSDIVNIG